MIDGKDEESKASAQDVLYICLESGLKLLHPFMPFVTEELYQRLPRRPNHDNGCSSIMISEYPQEVCTEVANHLTNSALNGRALKLKAITKC